MTGDLDFTVQPCEVAGDKPTPILLIRRKNIEEECRHSHELQRGLGEYKKNTAEFASATWYSDKRAEDIRAATMTRRQPRGRLTRGFTNARTTNALINFLSTVK